MKFFKQYKAIVHVSNTYGLLQFLLITCYKPEDSLFILHPKFMMGENVYKLSFHPLFKDFYYKRRFITKYQSLFIRVYSKIYPKTEVYNSGQLLFTDLLTECFTNVYFLEDGVASYTPRCYTGVMHKSWVQKLFYGKLNSCFGLSEKVKKVFFSGIKLVIPECVVHKAVLFNMPELWAAKSEREKRLINTLLLPEHTPTNSDIYPRNILLLTQPLSEDLESVTEEKKIEMYKNLLVQYDEKKLVIKTHPREKTDYRKYFPDAYIIDNPLPMELFFLNNPNVFDVAITIESTSIHFISDSVKKISSGFSNFPKEIYEECVRKYMV